jgi:hypothetical protein
LISALFFGCSAPEQPESQFGRFNEVTLTSWASACTGQLAPQRVCMRGVGHGGDFERFPWTPECRIDDTQERLHCSGDRQWDLWLDSAHEWITAVCVHGHDEISVLENAAKTFGQVMSPARRDRAIGLALVNEHNRNWVWHDPEIGTFSLCWVWKEP